ncbi:MAG: phosphoribosylformylglycinamidine synthase subunit PurQ [Bacteroidales bacterium]
MKFGVVVFPGSNCDQDMIYVLQDILGHKVVKLWHKDSDLQEVDAIVLPGGFSYGDYLRSGAIARYSPIMEEVIKFAHAGGFVFGICNGFQILCEAGLLPGALLHNNSQKFICKNLYIIPDNTHSCATMALEKNKPLQIPVAHAEGRYFAKEDTLQQMRLNGQILFRYCNKYGEVTSAANPNGSAENIAGVCNERKNVFGMMPHPERAADEELGNTDGMGIFYSILQYLELKQ